MGPPEAMAAFLTTWRRQRAGLTRAQLADALTALLPNNNKSVTTHVVREWEKGQPPKSTDEFDALCVLMRRSGLADRELSDFRRAVLMAVCERQYPGLLTRPDTEGQGPGADQRSFP